MTSDRMVPPKWTSLLGRWVSLVQNSFHAVSSTSHTTSWEGFFFFFSLEAHRKSSVMAFWCCNGDKKRKGSGEEGAGSTCKKTVHRSRREVTSSVFDSMWRCCRLRGQPGFVRAWAGGAILWFLDAWHAQETGKEWSDSFSSFIFFNMVCYSVTAEPLPTQTK